MIRKIGMLLLLTILSIGLLLPNQAVEASASKKYVESKVNGLNIRSSASVNAKKVGVLNKGQRVTYVHTQGGWFKVNYKGKSAFVSKQYAKVVSQKQSTKEKKTSTTTKKYAESKVHGLNVRSSASAKGKVVGSLRKGDRVSYVKTQGNWTKVSYKGKSAYVAKRYVKVVNKASSTKKAVKVKRTLTMQASAYTPYCRGCSGVTALGWDLRKTKRNVIAVDPRVIPLGTKVQLFVGNRFLGTYTAADTGGAIRGNKIDVVMYSQKEAIQFGRRTVTVKVL